MSDEQNQDQGSVSTSALQALVGEGKKFENVDQLANGKLAADQHIEKLQSENKDLRQSHNDLNQQYANTLALVERLQEQVDSLVKSPAKNEQDPADSSPAQGTPDIDALLEAKLSQRSAAQQQEANKASMMQWISETFGDEAEKAFLQVCEQAHMTPQEFAEHVARKGPEAGKFFFRDSIPKGAQRVSSVSSPQGTISAAGAWTQPGKSKAPADFREATRMANELFREQTGHVYNPTDGEDSRLRDAIRTRLMREHGLE